MAVSRDDLLRTAHLSRLSLMPENEKEIMERLLHVFSWIDELQELDVRDEMPLINPLQIYGPLKTPEREDVVTTPNRKEALMKNAPEPEHGFFTVPKVVE